MIEFYPEIRSVHVAAVLASGSLVLLRGLLLFAKTGWARARPLRYLGYAIDTVLLTAALMLMTLVQQYPFADAWLTVKLLLLVVYIALAAAAFWHARTQAARIACWCGALAVYGFIFTVARTHDPLGVLGIL